MQKLFIVKETTPDEDDSALQRVNDFIGKTGKIITVTPFGVGVAAGGNSSIGHHRVAGRCLVVADDGKGENIGL